MLTTALAAVAFTAGIAGTWSPCGFSMIETISGPRRRVGLSCVTFALGACAGGGAVFGLLGLVGDVIPAHSGTFVAVVAVAAAIAEARGMAIRPQIRRQVPEHWRRVYPLPVAAALYGVLLGAGFTTFVYTFALWALALLAVVIGSPAAALWAGLAFGVGRALPIVLIAPVAHRRGGRAVLDTMAQRPASLRVVRVAAALCLLGVAFLALIGAAVAATTLGLGTDPSASGTTIVWTTPSGGVRQDENTSQRGTVPAHAVVGGSLLAWRDGTTVNVVRLADMSTVMTVDVPGVTAIAVSDAWLVTRERAPDGTETMTSRTIEAQPEVATISVAHPPQRLGRPALDGDVVVYHVAKKSGSTIEELDLRTGERGIVRQSETQLLTNPSLLGTELLYNRQTSTSQLVELGPLDRTTPDRVLYRLAAPSVHDAGHEPGYSHHTRTRPVRTSKWRLWTTGLSVQHAYVTLLPRAGNASDARLLSLPR